MCLAFIFYNGMSNSELVIHRTGNMLNHFFHISTSEDKMFIFELFMYLFLSKQTNVNIREQSKVISLFITMNGILI